MNNFSFNNIEDSIKHFEGLQKRYTKTHNGKMCERVADALVALCYVKYFFDKQGENENES